MLQVIFDRVATYCAESLRHLAASQPYYSLSNVETGRIGDLLEMYEGNALAGIFNVPEWDNHVIVGFDRDFIFSLIEIMFGSDGSEPPIEDGRGFSNIEIHVAHAVFEQVARALQTSFALVSEAEFKFERSETAWTSRSWPPQQPRDRRQVSAPGDQPRRRDVRHRPAIGPDPAAPVARPRISANRTPATQPGPGRCARRSSVPASPSGRCSRRTTSTFA
jgi:hypothetical protein